MKKENNCFIHHINKAVTLYHGSKSGIYGKIAPISREHCDFGKGFYMGTDRTQPLTLICNSEKECSKLKQESNSNRSNGISLANEICRRYRRERRFFDEILEAGNHTLDVTMAIDNLKEIFRQRKGGL